MNYRSIQSIAWTFGTGLLTALIIGSSSAIAKPKTGCEKFLNDFVRTLHDHHLSLPILHHTLFLMMHPDPALRSRKFDQVVTTLKNRLSTSVTEFSDEKKDSRWMSLRHAQDLFKETTVLAINTVESLVFDKDAAQQEANLRLLRDILAERVKHQLPTLLVFDDDRDVPTYLDHLPGVPKAD